MTDNEIIRDFEKVIVFHRFTSSVSKTLRNTLDLIYRQKANSEGLTNAVKFLNEQLSSARAEAVKEYADRLQERCNNQGGCLYASDIGAELNEMVGDSE